MHLTIKKRVALSSLAFLFLTAILGLYAIERLRMMDKKSRTVAEGSLPSVYLIGGIQALNQRNYALLHRYCLAEDAGHRAAIDGEIQTNSETMARFYKQYEAIPSSEKARPLFDNMKAARAAYIEKRKAFLADSASLKGEKVYSLFVSQLDPEYNKYLASIQALVDYNREYGEDTGKAIVHAVDLATLSLMAGLAAALALGIAVAAINIYGITRILGRIAASMSLGSSYVAGAAGEVASASHTLAEGASAQAASLEETSASLEEMSSMTRQTAENAKSAKALAAETRTGVDAGWQNVQRLREAMGGIKASSDNIAKIIKNIDEIAFQTNILALNAAVEAARAGEAGMGFAVVADEVRALAHRCASSARETADKVQESIQTSQRGVEISEAVASSLQEVVAKVRRVDELVAEIATASAEHSDGLQQVNGAVAQIDKITQENAASSEECAAAAEQLKGQARSLDDIVEHIVALVGERAIARRGSRAAESLEAEEPDDRADGGFSLESGDAPPSASSGKTFESNTSAKTTSIRTIRLQ